MKTTQYTVRGIKPKLDYAVRQQARERGVSINSVLLDALTIGLNLGDDTKQYHDLDELAGTWQESDEVNEVLNSMRQIDQDIW